MKLLPLCLRLLARRIGLGAGLLLAFATLPATAAPGDVDLAFNPNANGHILAIAVQVNGKVVIGGGFEGVVGAVRYRIARLNPDGTLDAGFNPNASLTTICTAIQPDGKIVIGGTFSMMGGVTRNGIARLNPDGTLDAGFNPSANNSLNCAAIQPDGKIVIGGLFTTVGGVTRNRIARLNPDGTLDTGFNPNANGTVISTAIQPDGKIVIGGSFNAVAGVTRNRIARLNSDGTLDTGFNSNQDFPVYCAAIQPDGKIVIGGLFTTAGGVTRNRIARLNPDGTLDTGFDPNANDAVQSITLQADGKIVIGGWFTQVGGAARNRIARLHADGTLDTGFDPNANNVVYSTAIQADGKVVMGGHFTVLGGTSRNRIARLDNDAATQILTVPNVTAVQWTRGGATPETTHTTFELSTDGGTTWTLLGPGTRVSGGWELTGLSLPTSGAIRARARTTGGAYNGSSGLVEQQAVFSLDSTPPTLGSATADCVNNKVTVIFSEAVAPASATAAANYAINNGVVIQGVQPGPTADTIYLLTTSLTPGVTYTLTVNNVTDQAAVPNVIAPNSQISFSCPACNAPVITTQPLNQTVQQNGTVTFTVVATGDPPLNYAWYHNGQLLANANGPSCTLSSVTLTDAGVYTVEVSNPCGMVTSAAAQLTVTPDTTPPTVVSVEADCTLNTVNVNFSELLEQTTAEEPFNYTITDGINTITFPIIQSAVLAADGKTVGLTLDPGTLVPGVAYTLTVDAVTDLAGNPIVPGSIFSFGCTCPVNWWPMEGSVVDVAGASQPSATASLSFVPGKIGQGVTLAPGGYIEIPHTPAMAHQQFTLEAWVRPDGPGPNDDGYGSVILQKMRDSSFGYGLWWNSAGKFSSIGGSVGSAHIISVNNYPIGCFHHVVATYDGATFKLFVNGQLQGQQAGAGPLDYSGPFPWTIGTTAADFRSDGYPRTWNGVIDEVKVCNRALSAAEIQAEYLAGGPGLPPDITCPADITVNISGPSVVVNYPTPTVTGGVLDQCQPPNGSVFLPGSTVVTCTARNACGDTDTCQFTVTVINNCACPIGNTTPPLNDSPATATPLTAPATVTGCLKYAGPTPPGIVGTFPFVASPLSQQAVNDVWYSFSPTVPGVVTVDTCGPSDCPSDTVLAVYQGSPDALIRNPSLLGGNQNWYNDNMSPVCGVNSLASMVKFNAKPCTTYYIRVSARNPAPAPDGFTLNLTQQPAGPPPNDACQSYKSVSPNSSVPFHNGLATTGASPLPAIHNDVWFRFVAPPLAADATVETCTTFASALAIYAGNNCNSLVQVPVTTQPASFPPGTVGGKVTFPVTPGARYWVRVGGVTSADTGCGFLRVSSGLPPLNTLPVGTPVWCKTYTILGRPSGLPWSWSLTSPRNCRFNIQGTAGPTAGITALDLATDFANSINLVAGQILAQASACPAAPGCTPRDEVAYLKICTPCVPWQVALKVGPQGSPDCWVENQTMLGAISPCVFNPIIYEISDPDADPDAPVPDCNGNGVPDYVDITLGSGLDEDGNGVPDECPIRLHVTYTPLDNEVIISWPAVGAVLEQSTNVSGPWTEVSDAKSPHPITSPTSERFFRLRLP